MTLPSDWYKHNEGEAESQALPAGMRIIKVGNTYRAVWGLGDGLGWAWYSLDQEDVNRLFKGKITPHATLSNVGQFERAFGNNYWGSIAEVNLKADDPWLDLKEKIFNQFGWVPGLDNKEIKRLLIQGYFEKWNENQWLVEYRKTEFYQNTTDTQRQWIGYSEAEKKQRIQTEAAILAQMYFDIYGVSVASSHKAIQDAAFKIASGQIEREQWEFNHRQEAATREGSPEWARRQQQAREGKEELNREEDLAAFAEDQWRAWVGPIPMPANFAKTWGKNLATAVSSEADLEKYLKQVAQTSWAQKPPDLTWADWAAPFKSQIADTLELGATEDTDPLLKKVLNTDLTGQDLEQVIRADQRFLSTKTMYGELSSAAADMGRRFGFIS